MIDGVYDERRDAYWSDEQVAWVCAACMGVLGSIGCCRTTLPQDAPPAPRAAETPGRPAKVVSDQRGAKAATKIDWRATWTPKPGPFDVRAVDIDTRKLVLIKSGVRLYADACIIADACRLELGCHMVVYWPEKQRVLYDSREIEGVRKVEDEEDA